MLLIPREQRKEVEAAQREADTTQKQYLQDGEGELSGRPLLLSHVSTGGLLRLLHAYSYTFRPEEGRLLVVECESLHRWNLISSFRPG